MATHGRPGFGPGEFRVLGGVAVLPDGNMLIYDPAMPRFTTLSPTGEVIETRTAENPASHGAPQDVLRLVGTLPGDRYLLAPAGAVVWPRAAPGPFVEQFPLLVYDTRGRVVGPFGPVWRMEMWGDDLTSIPVPFSGSTVVRPAGDRVYVGHGGPGRIEIWVAEGRLVQEVVLSGTTAPVTPELARAWMQERASEAAHLPGATRYRQWLALLPFPDRVPFFDDLVVDGEGRMWLKEVQLPGAVGPAGWIVLAPDGVPLARIHLPSSFRPVRIQGYRILGIRADSLGAQSVEVYLFQPEWPETL